MKIVTNIYKFKTEGSLKFEEIKKGRLLLALLEKEKECMLLGDECAMSNSGNNFEFCGITHSLYE